MGEMVNMFGKILAWMSLQLSCCIIGNTGWGNVALNKPAYQISTKDVLVSPVGGRVLCSAGLAVDGDKNTNLPDGSCMHTKRAMNPWWIVDLEKVYKIRSVEITSRNLLCRPDLANFTIEMSGYMEGDPSLGVLVNPVLCLHYPGIQPGDTRVVYPCDRPVMGRYVKIMRYYMYDTTNPAGNIMYFCEVEVHGTDMERFYSGSSRPGKRSTNAILSSQQVKNVLHCSSLCREYPTCTSFNIKHRTGPVRTCDLIADPVSWVFDNEVSDSEWTHYVIE